MKDPNRFYTYAYLRVDRSPYYIGKGQEYRLYEKYGREIKPPKDKSRIIFLKQNLTEEEAFKHEKYMISVFGRKDLGTGILRNRTDGGEGGSGAIRSEETKIRISKSKKGKLVGKDNPFYGKSHSEENRRKQSEAKKGKSPSEETRKKQSEKMRGENNPNYGKRGSNSPNYGRKHTNETKIKLRESNLGEKNPRYGKSPSEEERRKRSEIMRRKKWWNDGRGNSKMSEECPGENWVPGRGKQMSERGRKNYENGVGLGSRTEKERKEIAIKTNSQRWMCTETGFVSTPGSLTNYQRNRGIDTSKRKRVS